MGTQRQTTVIDEARPANRFVPFIRIRGRWLEEAGFETGDVVQITVEDRKLTLTLKEDDHVQANT